jgi:enterochelin esterase-like enzyme
VTTLVALRDHLAPFAQVAPISPSFTKQRKDQMTAELEQLRSNLES